LADIKQGTILGSSLLCSVVVSYDVTRFELEQQ